METKDAISHKEQFANFNKFGELIRQARIDAEFSLSEFSIKLKVTKGYLSKLESGKAKPSRDFINKINSLLNLDSGISFLLSGYIPSDVRKILYSHPKEASSILKETFPGYQCSEGSNSETVDANRIIIPALNTKNYEMIFDDCFNWMRKREANSIHAIVTDPPYSLKEYNEKEKTKLRTGNGGIWRQPPSLDGYKRNPLPRFTVLDNTDRKYIEKYFREWSNEAFRILVPGAHIIIATNPLLSHHISLALTKTGFEKRGEIIRLVQTLRGGDRPKNAHNEFANVTVMPRSCWEPWGLFRKSCAGRVQDNLRKWKTGGLRRKSDSQPFMDVIKSAPTRANERELAPHPSLKPQAFMRQIVYSALPLGQGIILDPFMGAGSTIAAAHSVGYESIGIENDPEFYKIAGKAVPKLASLSVNGDSLNFSRRPVSICNSE